MIELLDMPEGSVRVWEVWVNVDSIEGRGPMKLHARFLSHEDAMQEARGKGPMGCSDADVRQAVVFNSVQAFHHGKDQELKRQALRKLSADERRVLGL